MQARWNQACWQDGHTMVLYDLLSPTGSMQMMQVVSCAGAASTACCGRCSQQKDLGEGGRDGRGEKCWEEASGAGRSPLALALALAGCWEVSQCVPHCFDWS